MRNISHTPAYNMKVVMRETGLTADVLRVWERRYGLPTPKRSEGGHRLYSEHDIETIRWLIARQEEGFSIRGAVELWREIAKSGKDPLEEKPVSMVKTGKPRSAVEVSQIGALRQKWLGAVLSFDEARADEALNQAFALNAVERVCIEILQEGLSQIGELWYCNQASVQQEHFASALAVRRLQALIAATSTPTRRQTVLLGCPPGEWHTFPALLLCLLLRRRGLDVLYLGADIPIDHLKETAAAIQPAIVVLCAQQLNTAIRLRRTAELLREIGIPLAFGGLIFNRIPRLHERIPAHFLGENLEDSVEMIERLLRSSAPSPVVAEVDPAFRDIAGSLRDLQPSIKNELLNRIRQGDFQVDFVGEVVAFLGERLAAALEFGDPAFIEPDLEWVKRLLVSRQIPEASLIPFLTAYHDTIRKEMGEASAPITQWISAYLRQNGGVQFTNVVI